MENLLGLELADGGVLIPVRPVIVVHLDADGIWIHRQKLQHRPAGVALDEIQSVTVSEVYGRVVSSPLIARLLDVGGRVEQSPEI